MTENKVERQPSLYAEADQFLTERRIRFANEADRIAGCSLMAEFAEERVAALENALRRYGNHLITCPWSLGVTGKKCDCGFEELLAQSGHTEVKS